MDSNACPLGVPGLGIGKVTGHLESIQDYLRDNKSLHNKMMEWATKDTTFSADVINTCVDNIHYEPTNEKIMVAVNLYVKGGICVWADVRLLSYYTTVLTNWLVQWYNETTI